MSQGTRSIVWASTKDTSGAKTVYSNASTLGELKNRESDIKIAAQGMKAWVKEVEGSEQPGYALTSDASVLPTGNFELAFLVDKNDSGVDGIEEIIDQFLNEMAVH